MEKDLDATITTSDDLTQTTSDASKPPDGGYGWVILACSVCINCFTWGVISVRHLHRISFRELMKTQSYGVFLSHYLEDGIFPDATPLDYALIGGLNFGVTLLCTFPVNWLTRRFGIHPPMFVGIFLQVSGFIAASFARNQIYQLYLSQGVLVGLGVGFLWVPSIALLPQWFEKRRSVAVGIGSAGAGVGGIIFSFAISAAIRNVSLGWALRMTGIVSGAMNLIAASLMRTRNAHIQPYLHPFDARLFKRLNICLLLGWAFVIMFGYIVLVYSLPDFSRSIGLAQSQGATVNALFSLSNAIGRPCIGLLSDRYGRIEVAGLTTFTCAIIVFAMWIPTTSYTVVLVFAVINGGISGIFWAAIVSLCAEVVGLKQLPSLLSLAWAMIALPATCKQAFFRFNVSFY
jgi:MFS family permease